MKSILQKLSIAFLLLFIVVLAGCADKEEGKSETAQPVAKTEAPTTITITDTAGKEITVDLPITKAVVVNRNTAEALKVLGVDEEIIATGDTTLKNNAYLGFEDRPDVGKTAELNLEAILSLKPEVVFTYTNRPDSTLEEKLEPAGIKVIRLNNYLPEQMDEELETLAKLFGKEDKAAEFLAWKHDIEDELEKRVKDIPESDKKTVLALSAGALNSQGNYNVFPSASLNGEPGVGEGYATILAGGLDAANLEWNPAETSTTINVDEEYVLQQNPDVITLHGNFFGGYEATDDTSFKEVYDGVMVNTAVKQMTAGKNKDVYMFYTNIIGSDKGYIGRLQLAKYLYPERFSDVNPDSYLQEYFEKWLGLEAKGIWYYGPEK